MPQGKMKTKVKLPAHVQRKKGKGTAITKRGNAPKTPKKTQTQKLKRIITKTVNATAEEELRVIALNGQKSLLSKGINSANNLEKLKAEKKNSKKQIT